MIATTTSTCEPSGCWNVYLGDFITTSHSSVEGDGVR